jgi:radical SAM superfamily enzyme YgiQ (UPF0313 family)
MDVLAVAFGVVGGLAIFLYGLTLLSDGLKKVVGEKIKRKIEEYKPDIIGITCVTMNYPVASEILKYCKSVKKKLITVIGGPHVTFNAEGMP